jgi:hypothetical protein
MLIDHVIFAAASVSTAAARLRSELGLGAVPGGQHPEHGTANWIVPFQPPQYLELLEVADPVAAAASPLGAALTQVLAVGEGLCAWAVQDDDLDSTAQRLGIEPVAGHLADPAGNVLGSWRTVADPSFELPFFVKYDKDLLALQHQFYAAAEHTTAPAGIAWIEVGGDAARLREWLGPTDLPVRFVDGPPGPRALGVRLRDGDGELVVR